MHHDHYDLDGLEDWIADNPSQKRQEKFGSKISSSIAERWYPVQVKKEIFHDVKKFATLCGNVTKITNAANESSINVRNKVFESTEYSTRDVRHKRFYFLCFDSKFKRLARLGLPVVSLTFRTPLAYTGNLIKSKVGEKISIS